MNEVNKTLYIPLYGKALISKKGIILNDKKAEEIWDVYTEFGAKASKYKHPVNDIGVQTLNGIDHIHKLLIDTKLKVIKEYSFTPEYLVDELKGFEKLFFKFMFTGKLYSKIYRLYELG